MSKKFNSLVGLVSLGVAAAGAAAAAALLLKKRHQAEEAVDHKEIPEEDLDNAAVLVELDGDETPEETEAPEEAPETAGETPAETMNTVAMDTTGDGNDDTILGDVDGDGTPDVAYISNPEVLRTLEQTQEPEEESQEPQA